jgi:ABC-2 type transport system permease protein
MRITTMTKVPSDKTKSKNSRGHFSELLKVEGRLALREPYCVFGIIFPVVLLVIFWFIGTQSPGNVGTTGLTVLQLYIPTILVIGFITITLSFPNTLVRDREIGWLRRVSTTPVRPSRLIFASLILNIIFALASVLIIIFGGELLFGATLNVQIPFFILSVILAIAEIFSLGSVLAALAPSQTAASALGGIVFFLLIFLSGLWVQPALVGGALQTVMYYSPAGAAAEALLYSTTNAIPPYTAIATMLVYAVVFAFISIRYFRWE